MYYFTPLKKKVTKFDLIDITQITLMSDLYSLK